MVNDADDEEPTPEQLSSMRRRDGWTTATLLLVTLLTLGWLVAEWSGWLK